MKIHKNHTNSKQIIQEYILAINATNIDFSKIPSSYRKDKNFLRNCRKPKYGLTSANCNLEQSQTCNQTEAKRRPKRQPQTQSQEKKSQGSFVEQASAIINLSVRDKSGSQKFLSLIKGNTLIIGEDPAELLDRSIELHKIYLKNGFITRLISFRAFTALSFDEQTNPEIHYIVRFNKHNDIDELPYQLSTMFSNILIFVFNGLNDVEGNGIVGTQIQIGTSAMDALARLAIGTAHARQYFLPTLKKDEFTLNL